VKIGMTGTRYGMNSLQKNALEALILKLRPYQFHHGDCEGADFESHLIVDHVRQYKCTGIAIIVHPPEDDKHRAYCVGELIRKPLPYLERNKNIVKETDLLIAAPKEDKEQKRGGTWHTVRQARALGKQVIILWPSGAST
jgi:hypothetical protein